MHRLRLINATIQTTKTPPKNEIRRRLSSAMIEKFETMLGGNQTTTNFEPTTTHQVPTQQVRMSSQNQRITNKIQPTKELHPIPQTSHPPPTTTHSETGAKSKNMMTLKKTKNLTTPSPIRKKKEKGSEIVAKIESE